MNPKPNVVVFLSTLETMKEKTHIISLPCVVYESEATFTIETMKETHIISFLGVVHELASKFTLATMKETHT